MTKRKSIVINDDDDDLDKNQNKPIKEKRAKRIGTFNSKIGERIMRATTQRMYLIKQEDLSITNNNIDTINHNDNPTILCRKFHVLGSTGNVYEVHIEEIPSCTCPDFQRGNICKHLLFVLLKVCRISSNSHLLYQKALLTSELIEIFSNIQTNDLGRVLAKQEVILAYNKAKGEDNSDNNLLDTINDDDIVINNKSIKEPEGECAICFEAMIIVKNTTTNTSSSSSNCISMITNHSNANIKHEALDHCETCQNYLHVDCLKQWLTQSNTCVYCRSIWKTTANNNTSSSRINYNNDSKEGFINLASEQGLSHIRDTSTYNYHRRYRDYY